LLILFFYFGYAFDKLAARVVLRLGFRLELDQLLETFRLSPSIKNHFLFQSPGKRYFFVDVAS
jgi:hypothetical protein